MRAADGRAWGGRPRAGSRGARAMIFLRLLVVVLLAAVAYCAFGFVFTRERRYLRLAWRLLVAGLVAALVFFAVMFVQRLSGPVAGSPGAAGSTAGTMPAHEARERMLQPRRIGRLA